MKTIMKSACVVLVALIATTLVLWLLPTQSRAAGATFTVSNTQDSNDGVCDADCSLREAIFAANAHSGSDTIVVGPGHYLLTISGINDNSGATGDLDIGEFLTDAPVHVLHIVQAFDATPFMPTVVFSGVMITSGDAHQDY